MLYKAHMNTQFKKAIDKVGGQSAMAEKLGVDQGHVWNWLNRNKSGVPAEYCVAVETASDKEVTRYDLRPDVFGAAEVA